MTSETSYSNKNKFVNFSLLLDNIKRNKVLIIIIGIVMFFACPFLEIITYITRGSPDYYGPDKNFYVEVNRNILNGPVFVINILASVAFGLCLALMVMKYMHSTKASVFFGSIPIKKRVFYATQCLSGIIFYAMPLIPMYLLSVALLPSYVTFVTISKMYAASLLIFLLIYSFAVLCANIAGNAGNTVISGLYLTFFSLGWVLILQSFLTAFYRFTIIPALRYNLSEKVTIPVLYFIIDVVQKWTAEFGYNITRLEPDGTVLQNYNMDILIHIISIILISAAFFFLGSLLNQINKTENAEKAFYFKISQAIFKYTLLAMAVAVSGILFYENLKQSVFYIVLGIVVGGFLAFLIINFIIYKNIREIFNGLKKFGIFIVAASLIMCVFSYDIFGIDRYIPEVSQTESVKIVMNPHSVSYYAYTRALEDQQIYNDFYARYNQTITNPETIGLINNVFKALMKSTPAKAYDFSYYLDTDGYSQYLKYLIYLSGRDFTYTLKNGKVINKMIPTGYYIKDSPDIDECTAAISLLLKDFNFKKALCAPVTYDDYISNLVNAGYLFELTINDKDFNEKYDLGSGNIDKLLTAQLIEKIQQDIYSDEFDAIDNAYDTSLFLTISVKLNNGNIEMHNFTFYLNDSFKNTKDFVNKNFSRKN